MNILEDAFTTASTSLETTDARATTAFAWPTTDTTALVSHRCFTFGKNKLSVCDALRPLRTSSHLRQTNIITGTQLITVDTQTCVIKLCTERD